MLSDVVEEHVEEAAFLYEQRAHLRETGRGEWSRLEPIERRIEAHVDGAFVAGATGVALSERHARVDPGAAFVAGTLAAWHNRPGAVGPLWAMVARRGGRRALGHALVRSAPGAWAPFWTEAIGGGGPVPALLAARVAASRGLDVGPQVLSRLRDEADPGARVVWIGALGQLRYGPAFSVLLHRHLRADDAREAEAALLALVLGGVPQGLAVCEERARSGGAAALALAASGTRRHGDTLAAATRARAPEAAVALGLHGDPAHVPVLLDALRRGDVGAGLGLHLVTGAAPPEPDGRAWWEAERERFQPDVRYRLGAPFTAPTALPGEDDAHVPPSVRRWMLWELAVRYGAPMVSPGAFVDRQRAGLAEAVERFSDRPSGRWDRP